VSNTRHWQCNNHATDFVDWIDTPPTPSRQSRVVSQNVILVGIRNSIPTMQRILSSHNPAVVLLQDCQVKNSAREQVHAQLRKESSPNSNPSNLHPLLPPCRTPCVLGDRDQTRPMPTCTGPEPLEFYTQIIGIIPQAGHPPQKSSPNSNPSHLQPLPPPYRGILLSEDRYQTRPMPTCT